MGFMLLLMTLPTAACLFTAISPQKAWERLESWRYEHPEHHQPSADALSLRRFLSIVMLIAFASFLSVAGAVQQQNDSVPDPTPATPPANGTSKLALTAWPTPPNSA